MEGDRVGYEVMRDGDGREEEREWERERLFRVVRKSRCVSGSLDRPRPIPAPTTSPLSLSLLSPSDFCSLPTTTFSSLLHASTI